MAGASSRRPRRTAIAVLVAIAATALATMPVVPAAAQVEPPSVELTLGPGQSAVVDKTVHTSEVPPNPDIVFLADTTGSMGPFIADVRANASAVFSDVLDEQPSAQFGVAEYKDIAADGAAAFAVNQDVTGDTTAVQAGIDEWDAAGGGDLPEDALNALFELATGAVTFRPEGTRVIAWFGDAPSKDPSGGHTLADTIAALQAAEIRVVAVDVGNLNRDNQASDIAAATGGVFLDDVGADEVAAAILAGIQAVEVTVTPRVTACSDRLQVSFDPASRRVDSGDDATFAETIRVRGGTGAGTLTCTVDFLVDGNSVGFRQRITVHVPGLFIGDVTVTEGDAGTSLAFFPVRLSPASPRSVSVDFTTQDGTATAPADYAARTGTVVLPPGTTATVIAVAVNGDRVDEPDERFRVLLSNARGAAIVDGVGVGTILDDDRDGVFSCRASAARLLSIEPAVANPGNVPCRDDHAQVVSAGLNAGLIRVTVDGLEARTDQTPDDLASAPPAPGDNARADARVAAVTIRVGLLVTVRANVLEAHASATCVIRGSGGLTVHLAGNSRIAGLSINGIDVEVGDEPLDIPLLVGSLHLNQQTRTSTSLTQQALVLRALGLEVVVAEAKADVTGTPAHPSGTPCQE